MMSDPIFVDCCVLADIFIGEKEFENDAIDLRRKFPTWYSSNLIKKEFGNVLKTQFRVGNLSEEKALKILDLATKMVVICEEPSEAEILKEAIASGLTYYDATYVATARLHGLRFYTRDAKILKNCPDVARSLTSKR